MSNNRIFLSSPHMSGNEQKFINEAFKTNWIAPLGANVDGFEKEIAEYAGTKGAAAVSSGTAAIHLALNLLEVSKDDVVFCSSLTFIASANPIVYLGARAVFIDSEPETWNMSPLALKKALKKFQENERLPKAVIVVNLYGQSAKMDELIAVCDEYGVPIIEDAAESLGSEYRGKKSGSFGKFGIYSFNGNKIITTSSGGMLVSDDEEALNKSRFLATQARDPAPHYQHSEVGYNYRMSNVLAGIGRAQLKVLDDRVRTRRLIFNRYSEALSHINGLQFMPELESTMSNRWLTTLTIDSQHIKLTPYEILDRLAEENIEVRPVWKPLHLQPIFEGCDYFTHEDGISVSDKLFATGLCLPSGSNMKEEEQQRVITTLLKLLDT
jgi:pyridoxal phosphate-dependent aminotransferase EpsN